jgi:hypothetical protein
MRKGHLLCAALLTLVSGTAVVAQTPPVEEKRAGRGAGDAAGRGAADAAGNVKPGELANALDQYALIQARRMLQMDDAQYMQFVPRLKSLQITRRRNTVARARLVQSLRKLSGPRAEGEPDDKAILDALTALHDHDDRALRELQAAYAAVDEVLTVRQRARFRLFEENIENRKLDLLMRARSQKGGTP